MNYVPKKTCPPQPKSLMRSTILPYTKGIGFQHRNECRAPSWPSDQYYQGKLRDLWIIHNCNRGMSLPPQVINHNIAQKLFEGMCVPVIVKVEVGGKQYIVQSFCHNIPSTNPTEGYTVVKCIMCPGMSAFHKRGPCDNIQPLYAISDHYLILPNIAMIINTDYPRLD